MKNKAEKIAQLNDAFRQSLGQGSPIFITPGIQALASKDQFQIVSLVSTFNDFSKGNNPYRERDFGAIDFKGNRVLWKIDYYDEHMECGSEDPADPAKTTRVMTIMMAYEY